VHALSTRYGDPPLDALLIWFLSLHPFTGLYTFMAPLGRAGDGPISVLR